MEILSFGRVAPGRKVLVSCRDPWSAANAAAALEPIGSRTHALDFNQGVTGGFSDWHAARRGIRGNAEHEEGFMW